MSNEVPGRIAMRQSWRHLLFLHWPVPVETLRPLIPPELEIDTYRGEAYVGLVPFTMTGVRPVFTPSLPRLSSFHETNVRTYVRHSDGVPAVWFFSLDAASSPAVRVARLTYRLPYYRARMEMTTTNEGCGMRIEYVTERLWPEPTPARCRASYTVDGETYLAQPGTLDEFLIERYVLFSHARRKLYRARVHHVPYPLRPASVSSLQENMLSAAGIDRPEIAPIVHYSTGVDVNVEALRVVR